MSHLFPHHVAHSLTHLLAPKLQLAVIAECDLAQTPSAFGYLEKSHFIQLISGIRATLKATQT